MRKLKITATQSYRIGGGGRLKQHVCLHFGSFDFIVNDRMLTGQKTVRVPLGYPEFQQLRVRGCVGSLLQRLHESQPPQNTSIRIVEAKFVRTGVVTRQMDIRLGY